MDILRTEHDTLAATATDREGERMAKQIKAIFGLDIDAVGGWLGSCGGADSPSDIQRGMFAGDVGTPHSPNSHGFVNPHDGVQWLTMAQAADDFRRRRPFAG